MTQGTSTVSQQMIDASSGGRWTLVRVGIQIRILAGREKGNVEDYMPETPSALIIPGTFYDGNLKTLLLPRLMHKGLLVGEHTDHDMTGSKVQGTWQDAQVRLYSDITWPGGLNIVCVAVAYFPIPRAYSECPEVVQPFTRQTVEEYVDKYRLAMDAVRLHGPDNVEVYAAVPMGTNFHIQEGDTQFVLSHLLPALREHLSHTVPVRHLDVLCYEEEWVKTLTHGADEVVTE